MEGTFREAVEPLIQTYFVEENQYCWQEDYRYIYCSLKRNTDNLYADMPCDVKNMPCETYIVLDTELPEEEAFASGQKLARKLAELGYRIDEYQISCPTGDGRYYVCQAPTETLLSAGRVDALAEYRLIDEYRTPLDLIVPHVQGHD